MSSRTIALLALLASAPLPACVELPRSKYQTDEDGGLGGEAGALDAIAVSDGHECPPQASLIAHNLRRLNEIRQGRWGEKLAPLKPDACLEQLASTALDEWTAGGAVHGKFERECLPRVPECECYWEQENAGWSEGLTWKRSIDKVLGQMMAEEFFDGGHFRNIISSRWTIVGIAIDCQLDGSTLSIHLVNEFGP